ncbi:hypothetical protein H0266_02570 [Halobacillus locisalis]|uniref:Uncharacterized protein n=1 Tax=Halobacillus locisalis TaxID=220753 RepID=A0A838CP87_9BACI|nr:hypothetical protein [Halobacillus locisalis]MBA2173774.1 hypothetical protein [Halobacillus locisalis]
MRQHVWKVVAAVLFMIAAGSYLFMTQAIENHREKVDLYRDWAKSERWEYQGVTEHISRALASSSPDVTLDQLYKAVASRGNRILDRSVPDMMGIPRELDGTLDYPFNFRSTYGYINYLIETWDDEGLSQTEWNYLNTTILERFQAGEEAFEDIESILFENRYQLKTHKIEQRLREFKTIWDSYRSPNRSDPEFDQYLVDQHQSGIIFEDEPEMSLKNINESVAEEMSALFAQPITLQLSSGGNGGLHPQFGERIDFETEKGDYEVTATVRGGHMIGFQVHQLGRTESLNLTVEDMKEDALRRTNRWRERSWKPELTKQEKDTVEVSIYRVTNNVVNKLEKVTVTYHHTASKTALIGMDFSDVYKQNALNEHIEREPVLSEGKARSSVNLNLKVRAEGVLELVEERDGSPVLTYRYAVEGVEGVNNVWIGAHTGEFIRSE